MAGYGLIVVDMIKDNVNTQRHGLLDREATKLIPNILHLTRTFRRYGEKVIFACDSFMEDDFIFGGQMRPHAIRGTGGDQPIDELEMQPTDLFLAKRRMSSFHKTDLDQTFAYVENSNSSRVRYSDKCMCAAYRNECDSE